MSEKPRLDTTRLQKIAQAYWESAALMAAVELEVFTAIAHGHDTIPAAAKAVGISERNAERLLTALTAMTLLTREGDGEQGRFANAPDVQRFLVKDGERYAGPWILFTKPRWAAFGELGQRLRSTTENRLGAYESFTVDDARRYHAATYSIGMGAARLFSRSVDLSGRKKMLDLGGGSGAYSIVATKTFPGLKAIVLDLPPVAVVAGEYIAANEASDRVSALAGDFTRTRLPAGRRRRGDGEQPAAIRARPDPAGGRQGLRRPGAGRRDAPDRRDPARRPARAAVGRAVGPQRGGLGQHRPSPTPRAR